MRVLIVEDEPKMAGLLHRGLTGEGLAVDVAPRGEDTLWRAEATEYDAIVLDVMLPGIDGFEVCRRLRAAEVWAPVLMLTAPRATPSPTASPAWTAVPTTTWPSPSPSPSCSRACARSPAADARSGRRSCRPATSGSTRHPAGRGAARRRSRCRARSSPAGTFLYRLRADGGR